MKSLVFKIINLILILFIYSCASNEIANKNIEYIDLSNNFKKVRSAKVNFFKETIKDKDKLNRIKEKKKLKLAKINNKIKKSNKKVIRSNTSKNKTKIAKKIKKQNKSLNSKNTEYAKAEIINFEKNFSYDEYKNLITKKYKNKKYPDISN